MIESLKRNVHLVDLVGISKKLSILLTLSLLSYYEDCSHSEVVLAHLCTFLLLGCHKN